MWQIENGVVLCDMIKPKGVICKWKFDHKIKNYYYGRNPNDFI